MKVLALYCLILPLLFLSGCAIRTWNQPLTSHSPEGYVFANHLPKHNAKETFVVLAFSGGGTRSAAFSYGLLEKLRDTLVTIDGQPRSLLSEVDVVSSVSGGSYTVAYYRLFGARIFDDFEHDLFVHLAAVRFSLLGHQRLSGGPCGDGLFRGSRAVRSGDLAQSCPLFG